jgi:hypothetical protein
MQPNQSDRNSGLVRFFQRHVIPIQLKFSNGSHVYYALISSFVLSVQDQWMLMTAAHCLQGVETAQAQGYSVERCLLIDTLGSDARFKQPVPFDWSSSCPTRLFNDPDDDFGLIFVDGMTRRQLIANGVAPITEEAWDFEHPEAEAFMLIGVPTELARVGEPISHLTTVLVPVFHETERPEGLRETAAPRWYGRVGKSERFDNIDGMSGGPIFGCYRGTDGESRYWLHAVQSAWHKTTRAIAACPTRPVARLLAEFAQGKHRHLLSGGAP